MNARTGRDVGDRACFGGGAGGAGLPVFAREQGTTQSHQFAVEAGRYGGGQAASKLLARANILSCGIGLPVAAVAGDTNGLRIGTPEIVRWGMGVEDMVEVGGFVADVLEGRRDVEEVGRDAFRGRFTKLGFVR
jgi:glycine hydroxymethyltransferase